MIDQRIDPLISQASEPAPFAEASPRLAPQLLVVSVWGVLIGAVLLLLLIRPAAKDRATSVPAGYLLVSPMGRLVALAIDAVPCAALMLTILGKPVADLARLPFLTMNLLDALPYLGTAAMVVVHSTISEMIWRRTLGKAMIGAVIVRTDGSPVSIPRAFLRNALKLMVLLLPPVAVVAMLDRHLQGLPDQVAGTLVVRREEEMPETPAEP